MHFERILTGFRPKQIAMGLAAMLAVGAVQAAATPANAETLTMTFNQAASPSTTLGVGDVYQEGNMQIRVTFGSVSIGGSGVACLHSLGSGCLNVLSTTALFELTLIDGGRFKLKTAPGAWAERANTFDGVLQIYSDVNRAQNAYWSFCDPAYDGQRTTNPSPPVDCPEGDKIQFVDQTVASSFVEIVVETPSGPPLDCDGFMPPFDQALSLKAKAKRAIPIKLELYDADGYLVTDQDIVAPPVINVGFNGQVPGITERSLGRVLCRAVLSLGRVYVVQPHDQSSDDGVSSPSHDCLSSLRTDGLFCPDFRSRASHLSAARLALLSAFSRSRSLRSKA